MPAQSLRGTARRNAALFVAISVLDGFGGNAMSLVTGIWLLDLTHSSSLAALAGLGIYAPSLAGPWLGGLLDRLPRRPSLIAINSAMAAILLSLFAVHTGDQTWLIFTVALAYGVSYVLRDAGEMALLPATVATDHLADVNGWRSSAQEGLKLVAPLGGAGLYAWRGAHAVAALSATMLVVAATLYAGLRLGHNQRAPARLPPSSLRYSFAVLRSRQPLRVTIALAAVAIATSGLLTAATYTLVTTGLRLPATYLGILSAAQGAGSVLSGLLVGRLIARRGTVAVGTLGTALFAIAMLARCLPWWPVTIATGVIAGIGLPWTLTAAVTAVQKHTPAAVLGRVSATANTVMFGPIALAIPLGSAAVNLGDYPILLLGGSACLVAAAWATRQIGRLQSTPDASLETQDG